VRSNQSQVLGSVRCRYRLPYGVFGERKMVDMKS